jgi:UDP-N-acetylmuramate dehydrogenase
LIEWTNALGLAGLERMYGIPGTLAGAVVGNAGAYGQEISQVVRRVRVWREGKVREIDASRLDFSYRHSRFKLERDKFIVSCLLELSPSTRKLQKEADEILRRRELKYPPGLRCPGSFFKNVLVADLPAAVRQSLPPEFVMFDKVPAGKEGGAEIASYHGNLLINREGATSRDVLRLAQRFADLVQQCFGIALEPEIRLARGNYFRRPGVRKIDAGRDTTVSN